jgi:hypothetical protein
MCLFLLLWSHNHSTAVRKREEGKEIIGVTRKNSNNPAAEPAKTGQARD